jgi:hypothetical protein
LAAYWCRDLEAFLDGRRMSGRIRTCRPRPDPAGSRAGLTPIGGDLVVMRGRCQRDWRHCVPEQATAAGAGVSVNFSSRWQAMPARCRPDTG